MSKRIFIYTSNIQESKASIRAGLISFVLFAAISILLLIMSGAGSGFWVFTVIAMYFFVLVILEYVNLISNKRDRGRDRN